MKKRTCKILTLLLSIAMIAGVFAGCGGDPTGNAPAGDAGTETAPAADGGDTAAPTDTATETGSFPRNETLYMNGLQWGAVTNWNPYSSSQPAFLTNTEPVPRVLVFETLFIYNQLDGKLYGLLGTDYSWDGQVLTVKMNPDAHWNDGTPLTAQDVEYTFSLGQKYDLRTSAVWTYLSSVTATDDETVVFTGNPDNFNPKEIENAIGCHYIVPKHIWEGFEEESGNDGAKLMQIVNADAVASGPYKVHTFDDTKMAVVRDDNYWGQAESMWGKLPAPKYIVHNIFKDNAAGDAAFREGQVDVSQQFTSQIWKMWEEGLPIETYLPDAPYYIPGTIPSVVFNTSKSGLDDPVVRKAIAMSIDYEMIGQNAMSGYTAPMVPSLMLPTAPEQALINADALAEYQWTGKQAEEAAQLLEDAGWVAGSDGIREKDGVKLSFKVECPSGWTDWMASLEVIAQSTKPAGIDIQTYFPEATVWETDRQSGNFDILMTGYAGVGIASPWMRARQTLLSRDVPAVGEGNAYYNFGRYANPRVDELIDLIAVESDEGKVKEYWTELNQIYLEDVPTVGLMYRPLLFHQVNTSVWEGFPKDGDGSNIPPCICADGYGIAALYNITAKS